MNISYEKSKSLKDKNPKFKKFKIYPRTNKNRFTRNLLNLFNLLNPRTPLQMVSELSEIKSTEEIYVRVIYVRVKIYMLRVIKLFKSDLELKIYLQRY